ncbi:MAG: Gfo/Idh/MocA family oxidoreductase [Acidimicrobiia bacterium]|nr:Gfo/Idh/MocA family oxidoreductase [Acidimicrobiia bacterium]NNF64963.1 Gfo/Idh/MocA family oxidoreductase [Acidimicrobiia bacterium]
MRYGIIGSGMMGIEHILNLQHIEGALVTAVADPHEPSQQAARAAVGDPGLPVFADHREMLESDLCDAVVLATPNMTHGDILLDILAVDRLHALVEKPLCTTMDACRDVVAASKDRSGIVWMGLEYRYKPPIARLIEEVNGGAAGPVKMVAIREHRFPFLQKVDDWNRFNRNSGGTLVEKCCHFFDLMTLIAGAKPVRVMASGAQDLNHLDESYGGETPDIIDNAYVIVEYDNGVRAVLDLCMFAEGSRNEQEISVVGDVGKVEAFVPEGVVRIGRRDRGRDMDEIKVHDPRIAFEGLHEGSSFLEHLDFAQAIRTNTQPLITLEDGMLAVAVGVAGQMSIAEGRAVPMDEVL